MFRQLDLIEEIISTYTMWILKAMSTLRAQSDSRRKEINESRNRCIVAIGIGKDVGSGVMEGE